MQDEVLDVLEQEGLSRRGLLVKGGVAAAGLTFLGAPAASALGDARGGDQGRGRHARRHGIVLVGLQEGRTRRRAT